MKPEQQIILSHSGKQHSYHVAAALNASGYLKEFHTSSYISGLMLQKLLLKMNNQYWTRRFIKGLHGKKVDANWRFELNEMIGRFIRKNSAGIEKLVYARDEKFDAYIAKKLLEQAAPFFWGFQGSCLHSIRAAKKKQGFGICELATAHITFAKKILQEEKELLPEWSDSISNVDFPAEYEQRLEQEPAEADLVIAASSFTKHTLTSSGIPEQKIRLLPLGAPVDHIRYTASEKNTENRPLRLLYAGTVTQRKGIAYLLEAMKTFSAADVELHIIGGTFGSGNAFKKYADHYIYHGPVAQQELFRQYCQYDALVLPTVFEGFALVVVEAMAARLPVITTPHSIGPDLIREDENGYLIPVRDIQAIAAAIRKLRNKKNNEWEIMSGNARQTAISYSWENYQERQRHFLSELRLS